ncbi:MAG TPA: hypothetical protein VNY25_01995 [Steroidobacteraceae bacterium]|nr:hypothetical protein [Steroidobacteraceae bacterium]
MLIETERLELLNGQVKLVATPSASATGQRIARCPVCRVALWSHYAGFGDRVMWARSMSRIAFLERREALRR